MRSLVHVNDDQRLAGATGELTAEETEALLARAIHPLLRRLLEQRPSRPDED